MAPPSSIPDFGHAIKRQGDHPQASATFRPDIFDSLDHWLTSPTHAYASWINHQPLKTSTKTVYIAMFGRFCQWLSEQGKRLDQIDAHPEHGDITRFLATDNPNLPAKRLERKSGPGQSGRQRQQYVRQLERVFAHLGSLGYQGANPGQMAGRRGVGSGRDRPTRFPTSAERRTVIRLVQTRLEELRKGKKGVDEWVEYRDLALVATMIGAGLKVSHLQRLTLNCINLKERQIDLSRAGRAHRARVLAFAADPIEAWLAIQDQLHGGRRAPSRKVFEADRSSGFGRTSNTVTLAASSILRRTQRLLKLAGIEGERASPQTLRNAYIAFLIDGGATDEHLIDFLGLVVPISAQRLRAAYAKSRPKAGDGGALAEDAFPPEAYFDEATAAHNTTLESLP